MNSEKISMKDFFKKIFMKNFKKFLRKISKMKKKDFYRKFRFFCREKLILTSVVAPRPATRKVLQFCFKIPCFKIFSFNGSSLIVVFSRTQCAVQFPFPVRQDFTQFGLDREDVF